MWEVEERTHLLEFLDWYIHAGCNNGGRVMDLLETTVSLTAGPHMPHWASVLWYKVHFIPFIPHVYRDVFKALDNKFINMKALTLTAVYHASKWEFPNERSFVLDSLDHLSLSLWSVCVCVCVCVCVWLCIWETDRERESESQSFLNNQTWLRPFLIEWIGM